MLLRFLALIAATTALVSADVKFVTVNGVDVAGATIPGGGAIIVTFADSGAAPSIAELTTYQLFLCAGGNTDGTNVRHEDSGAAVLVQRVGMADCACHCRSNSPRSRHKGHSRLAPQQQAQSPLEWERARPKMHSMSPHTVPRPYLARCVVLTDHAAQLSQNDLRSHSWRHRNKLLPTFLPHRYDGHLPRRRDPRPCIRRRHRRPGDSEQRRGRRPSRRRCRWERSVRRSVLPANGPDQVCAYDGGSADEDHAQEPDAAESDERVYNCDGVHAETVCEDNGDDEPDL